MNLPPRIWLRRTVRLILAGLLLLWPMINIDLQMPFYAIILGAIIAYDGTEDLSVIRWAVLLLAIELVYSMDIGLISLAFVLTVGTITFLGQWINLRAWSREQGWLLISFVRTLLISLVASLLIPVFSTLIGLLVHGHDMFWERLKLSIGNWHWFGLEVIVAVMTILFLRWSDEPIRKRLIFGI